MEDDFEVIENKFEKGVENLDKSFIEDLKSKKGGNKDDLEKGYKKKLNTLKGEYEGEYTDVLKRKKIFSTEKEEKKEEEGEKKFEGHFKVEKVDFSPQLNEEVQKKKEFFLFVWGIKIRNFFRRFIPPFMIFLFLDMKLTVKLFLIDSRVFFRTAASGIKNFFVKSFTKIQEFFSSVFSEIKSAFVFVFSVFKKKEPAKKEGEIKAEGEKKEGVAENSSGGKEGEKTTEKSYSE